MPEATAFKRSKLLLVILAIILASVVLPVPGGPYNIIEGILSSSIMRRKKRPLPRICS